MSTQTSQNLLVLPTGLEMGKFRILRKLGQGGFGITYLAENTETAEQVVIKENLPTFCALRDRTTLSVFPTNPDDEQNEFAQYLTRFVDEAKLLAQLNHPNIVKILEAFEALGTAYYVMPWIGGQELQKAAPIAPELTEEWLRPILRALLGALEYLHSKNIYHRDVKPANILLTEDASPILIDFGTARAIISERSATHVGSPGYSPIEQLRAKGKRGPWTDVYSVGATCYRLITGERPPEAFDRLDEEEDPLRPLAPRVELKGRFSPEFLEGIDKALAIRAKDRWQTTTDWLAALTTLEIERTEPETDNIDIKTHTDFPVSPPQAPHGTRSLFMLILLILGLNFCALEIRDYLLERDTHTFDLWNKREKTELQATKDNAVQQLKANDIEKWQFNDKIVESAEVGDSNTLKLLISAGADVNAMNWRGRTPLCNTAANGHAECMMILLATPGIDVNKNDYFGHTPLTKAVYNNQTECLRLLLVAQGIDINKPGLYGKTPLQIAEERNYTECARLLRAAGGR